MNKRSWSLLGNLISSSDIFVLKVTDWQERLLSLVTVEMRYYQVGDSVACPSLSRGSNGFGFLVKKNKRTLRSLHCSILAHVCEAKASWKQQTLLHFQTHYWTLCNNDSYKTIIITKWITKHFACFNSLWSQAL